MHSQKNILGLVILIIVLIGAYFVAVESGMVSRLSLFSSTPKPPVKIGILNYFSVIQVASKGFKEEMSRLGYQENVDIVYEYQVAEGSPQKLNEAATAYVAENVDLIYAIATPSALAAFEATKKAGKPIPIVFAHADNPISIGLVASFKSSGNNVTGVAVDISELTAKRLEFLKTLAPTVKKIGVFNPKLASTAQGPAYKELKKQSQRFGFELVEYNPEGIPGPASTEELKKLAATIKPGTFDAIYHLPTGSSIPPNIKVINDLGIALKVPTVYFSIDNLVEIESVISYGHDLYAVGQQTARLVDKILKGTKPSDIPVEIAATSKLELNLIVAQKIGVQVPDSLLKIASRIIK